MGKHFLFHDPQAPLPTSQLVQQIYDVTGRSNPGFVKTVLDDLMKRSKNSDGRIKLPPVLPELEVDNYLALFDETIHEEVWAIAPPGVEALFAQGLCVLRRLNPNLLALQAKDSTLKKLFAKAGGPEAVLGALKRCRLLLYEYPLEVVDPVVRHILSQRLRRAHQERFAQAHQAAASAWHELLGTARDIIQLRYIREWLYHLASYLQEDEETEETRWQIVQAEVQAISFTSMQPPPVHMGETLLQMIEEKRDRDREPDGELLDVLLTCLGENNYQQLRKQLLAKQEEQ
jgi:hypothetical protein